MLYRLERFILLFIVILIFLLGATGSSHAVLGMNEVQYLFEQEMGRPWKDATSEERKDFVRDVRSREEYQEGKFKKKKRESDSGSNFADMSNIYEGRKRKAPYNVRSSFEVETGIEWDDATEEEQKIFWKEYKIEEKKQKREEKLYFKMKKLEERQRKREFRLKKQQMKLKQKLRAREEKLKRIEIKRKRKENKRAAKERKQEWEEAFREMRDRREKSKHRCR